MFGYIRPLKPELKIKDYETYRSVYCGLCKELGRGYGPFARLTLNYDFTFLALLMLALDESESCAKRERCIVHPFSRRLCCQSGEALTLTADAAMLMVYYKNLDNLRDGSILEKLISRLLSPFFALARRKAAGRFPELDSIMADMTRAQNELEDENCADIDRAADPTAAALSRICVLLSKKAKDQRILSRFGYLLGRWVYLIDALDDLERDYKSKGYNAFLLSFSHQDGNKLTAMRQEAAASLRMTHGEITKCFQLLTLRRHTGLLENIVYDGLNATLLSVTARVKHSK